MYGATSDKDEEEPLLGAARGCNEDDENYIQSQELKIDLVSGGSSEAGEDIPQEILKTLLSFFILLLGFLSTTFSLALTHDRVPDDPPLPDIVLDNTNYYQWGLTCSEIFIVLSATIAFLVVLFHHHRSVVFRRMFLLIGLLYMYRAMTMFVTVLPISDTNYKCAPKLNHTITFLELISRVATIVSGGGLSMNGKQIYCGDFIFSGHTMALLMAFFVVREYTPRKLWPLHFLSLSFCIGGVTMLLLSRGHYTIDVLVAYWITSRLWWSYHTLANNQGLKLKGEHNHLDNIWWWYIFRYFESNIRTPLPRIYSLPVPRYLQDKVHQRWRSLRSSNRSNREDQSLV